MTPTSKNNTGVEQAIKAGRLDKTMSFNQKVWAITSRIPRGRVVTYSDIARKLGTKAYRAVGNALNRNPYAPTVPCHRVVGSNGSLTGYAMGLAKKKQVLKSEGVPFHGEKVDLPAATCSL
jgi:methylated-DNA-[protein]-cysteine S-methyltransferase